MRNRPGGWLPLASVAALVAAVGLLLYKVWQEPPQHRDDLAIYGALVVAVVALVANFAAWAWRRARASTTDGVADEEELDRAADRLATAVRTQWETEAARRGLTGANPIQVTWGRPSQPMAGPAAALSARGGSTRCPGWRPLRNHG